MAARGSWGLRAFWSALFQTPPTANAGPPQETTPGEQVITDGSGSSGAGYYAVTYLWESEDGIRITHPNNVSASFIAPNNGVTRVFKIKLTVREGSATAVDYLEVTVRRSGVLISAKADTKNARGLRLK